jgi:hypothetical protein
MFAALLPLLAQIPALFDAGKSIYETVTGKPSSAATPQALGVEIAALPGDQQAVILSRLQIEVDKYRAENERLVIEEGEISEGVLRAIGPVAAANVALLRMTTRPKIVLWMAHVLLMPIYVMAYDMAVTVGNNLIMVFGGKTRLTLLAQSFFNEKSLYRDMYELAAGPAATIVVSYMILRYLEKTSSTPGDAVGQMVNSVVGMFKKKT